MTIRLSTKEVSRVFQETFQTYGFSKEDSKLITDSLIDADLRGIQSHGIQRLKMYNRRINNGNIVVDQKFETVVDLPSISVIDAHHGMGQVVSTNAMKLTIKKAKKAGVAIAVVRNSNHFGAAGYYSRMASKQGLVGISMTNTNPITIPTHGKDPFLGSNPIAFAMPAEPHDLVFDAATSTVSFGKIEILNRQSETIPGEWAQDSSGNLTHDPEEIVHDLRQKPRIGGILPIGGAGEANSGYKGYGISLIVEILTGILAQGTLSADQQLPGKQGISHFFMVIDPAAFGNRDNIKQSLIEMLKRLHQLPSNDGTPVLAPGDKEEAYFKENFKKGILAQKSTVDEIRNIATSQGVVVRF